MSNETGCKLVPYSEIAKLKGNEKNYQEALEASSSFNKRLLKDRKMRIPFIDSQTRVAQSNSMLWLMKYQRTRPDSNQTENGHVYTYVNRKWYKHRRLQIDPNDSTLFPNSHIYKSQSQVEFNLNENSNSMDSAFFQQHFPSSNSSLHQMLTKQTSNDDNENENFTQQQSYQQQQQHQQQQQQQHYSHHHSNSHTSHHNNHHLNYMHDDSFDNFDLNEPDKDSDEDDYEDTKKKKKKGGKQKKKTELAVNGDEKPYVCDRCGVKYKTKPGLAYHIQKAHNAANSSSNSNVNSSSNQNSIKQSSDILNPDENTTNSVFESGYDDMNSSSSLPHVASNNAINSHQNTQMYMQHHS